MSESGVPPEAPLAQEPPKPPRLLDRVRTAIRTRHYSPRTETAYVGWIKRYIFFHDKRHPDQMGAPEVAQFLARLATEGRVSASTQSQAFSALLFLYREVLQRELSGLETVPRAKRPGRLPLVLAHQEVVKVLRHLHGVPWLMASVMYGAGLRILESLRLRVKDLDFARHVITVRNGKGQKDRETVLPDTLVQPFQAHLERIRRQHDHDVHWGFGSVALPETLERKYPRAAWEWGWQWVFPATRLYYDRSSGQRRRHHMHESVTQRAFREAVRAAGIPKAATCHTLPFLRHPPPGGRLRHPHHPGTPGAPRRQHDHDLHSRGQLRTAWRPEPLGPEVNDGSG